MKFSISLKLFLAFGTVVLLIGVLGFLALSINRDVKRSVHEAAHVANQKFTAAAGMAEALVLNRLHMERMIASYSPAVEPPEASAPPQKEAGSMESAIQMFQSNYDICRVGTRSTVKLAGEDDDKIKMAAGNREAVVLNDIRERYARFKDGISAYPARAVANPEALVAAQAALRSELEKLSALVEAYRSGAADQLRSEVVEIDTAISGANAILLGMTLGILLVAGGLAWLISRSLTRPIRQLTQAAHLIGDGRFDTVINIESGDELSILARSFNKMAADLQSTTVSKDYVDGILKAMADTLIVVLPDRTIKYANQAALTLLGYTQAELVGQSFDRVVGATAKSLVEKALKDGFLSGTEIAYLTKNATPLPMSFSAAAMRDHAGAVTGLVCVAQGIYKRKQAETKMEYLQKELVEASRLAGMAELATSVLHNVGNVLNSVNVASSLLADSLKKSRAANLSKAVALIKEREADLGNFLTNDPKGKQIPAYLATLGEHLIAEQAGALKELDQLQKSIEHVKEIVSMQQSLARASGTMEIIKLTDLVEDALQMNANAFARHKIEVVRELSEVPLVTTQKHKVLQILINLLRNAKQACDGVERPDRRLNVRVCADTEFVRVAIEDNGVGIAPENLARIGSHGFTTKKDGHGFGLHSGMQAAKELGGSLIAHSDGVGKGATFTLELPLALPKPQPPPQG